MKIATWNVNSIKQRLDHVKNWLQTETPDILFLQELKGEEFPFADFPDLTCLVKNQKAYNGVAILSRTPCTLILDALPGDDSDTQARYLEAQCGELRLINIYLPNGNPLGTEKYDYKLAWMNRLYDRLKTLREERIPFLVGGDFNIIPEEMDCYDPLVWANDALFYPASRRKFSKLLSLGLYDAFRIYNKESGHYSFWDYQAGAWQRDLGIRIDHFLLSPTLTDRMVSCAIDRTPRSWEKASDHTPVIVEIA
jgi:exodeoxyribonuclease-3